MGRWGMDEWSVDVSVDEGSDLSDIQEGTTQLLRRLADRYIGAGDLEKAVSCFQLAIAIYRDLEDRQSEGFVAGELGRALHQALRFGEAIPYLELAVAVDRELKQAEWESTDLRMLAFAYRGAERSEESIALLEQVVAIDQRLGDREHEAKIHEDIGMTYLEIDQPDLAERAFQQSADLARQFGKK